MPLARRHLGLALALAALLWLGLAPAVPARAQEGLVLSGFMIHATDQPAMGDQVEVAFTLTNTTERPMALGRAKGLFVGCAVSPPGQSTPLSRPFGHQFRGWRLKPGQSVTLITQRMLDMSGQWSFWPGYEAGGKAHEVHGQTRTLTVSAASARAKPPAAPEGGAPAPPGKASATPTGWLRLVTYNIHNGKDVISGQLNLESVAEVVRGLRPDLLAVQEATETDSLGAAVGLPHYKAIKAYGDEDWRSKGLALYSRWPMQTRRLPLSGGRQQRYFIRADLDLGGLPLRIYAVHLARDGLLDRRLAGIAKEFLGDGVRQEQAESLADILGRDKHRFIVMAGDLNTFPLSGPHRALTGVLDDAFPFWDWLEGSYRLEVLGKHAGLNYLPNPKIDHVMHSEGIKVGSAEVITRGPSDHYPVLAVFRMDLDEDGLTQAQTRAAQAALRKEGLYNGPVNGLMGPATRRAITAFQGQAGLAIDGCLRPETLTALGVPTTH